MARKICDILTKEHAHDWKGFVAEFVRLSTIRKASQPDGYRVVKAGKDYEITWHGLKPYSPMNAEALYGWLQRLPLKAWADTADDDRSPPSVLATA